MQGEERNEGRKGHNNEEEEAGHFGDLFHLRHQDVQNRQGEIELYSHQVAVGCNE